MATPDYSLLDAEIQTEIGRKTRISSAASLAQEGQNRPRLQAWLDVARRRYIEHK